MSSNKKGRNRNFGPRNSSMADAFKKAGLDTSREEMKTKVKAGKSSNTNNRNDKNRSKTTTEKELLQKQLEGVQPLKTKGKKVRLRPKRKKVNNKTHKKGKRRKTGRSKPTVSTDVPAKTLDKVYGSSAKSTRTATPHRKRVSQLILSKGASINPAILQGDGEHSYSDNLLTGKGVHFDVNSEQEIELVIGLDFGTSYCKVVVQEPDSGLTWAVPLSDSKDTPFLLSTEVFKDSESFNLVGKGDRFGNLKVPLLNRDMPPNHMLSVIAFLALVLLHTKSWIVENKIDELAGLSPFWFVNMGLPARSLEDERMVKTFSKALWAAMLLAESQTDLVNMANVRKAFLASNQAVENQEKIISDGNGQEVHGGQVTIMPEIAAQIYGYLKSDAWDPSYSTFLLVDVGGGTVDGSIFHVETTTSEEPNFKFISSSVKNLGVYILHRERLEWHVKKLVGKRQSRTIMDQMGWLLQENIMPEKIPDSIKDYLQGAQYPKITSDDEFYNQFAEILWDDVIKEYSTQIGGFAISESSLPYMLCGGGREIGLYDHFIQYINWSESSTLLTLNQIAMPVPEKLAEAGISDSIYQRLSVAYGLSFPKIGEILTPDMFPPLQNTRSKTNYRDHFIGPEQT